MKQEDRYLTKVERFIKEEEFIITHTIVNEAISRIDELKSIVIKVAEH